MCISARRAVASFAASALAILLGACDLIPGTDAAVEKQARGVAAALLIDPASATFRNVERRDGVVCGEINAKNRMGAFVGFSRFYVDTSTWKGFLDPQFDPTELQSARDLCFSAGASASSYSCTTLAEQEVKQTLQSSFDQTWNDKCSSAAGESTSLPYDPTAGNVPSEEQVNWVEQPDPRSRSTTTTGNTSTTSSAPTEQDSLNNAMDNDGE